jgi:hypothetical protein
LGNEMKGLEEKWGGRGGDIGVTEGLRSCDGDLIGTRLPHEG